MNKTYVTIIVLVILVGGAVLIFGRNKSAEAPVSPYNSTVNSANTNTKGAGSVSPAPKPPVVQVREVAPDHTFVVTARNYSFSPSLLTVKKGDKVKIIFKNQEGFHDFKIDEFNVATQRLQVGGEESVDFVAYKSGTFQYYCSVDSHRSMGMWGTLKVE